MKQGKIYMKAWLDLHGRAKVLATDHWYLEFANLLLPVVSESYLYKSETQESQNQVTLMLTLYLEDCVTDGGNWRQFIRWHKRNYGRYLPFYELSEDYLADEINKEDIAFLLWGINSPVGDDFDGVENPLDTDLLEFADVIYAQAGSGFRDSAYQRRACRRLVDGIGTDGEEADCFACCCSG